MDRYSRQHLYKNIGKSGQKKLSHSSICIIGIGALGTVAADLLARAGIGKLHLVDRDFIEISNLQRQTLFDESDIGKLKADTAKIKLEKTNSEVHISSSNTDLDHTNISDHIGLPDLILGCTDNMESRFLINDYCKKYKIPWIYGGAVSDKGSVYNILPSSPCIRCVFPGQGEETCDTAGILNSAAHIVSGIMANEAIKILVSKAAEDMLIHIDVWKNEFIKIRVQKNKDCPACKGNYQYLTGKIGIKTVKLCGRGVFQIKGKKKNLLELKKKFEKIGKAVSFSGIVHFNGISVFEDGRAIIKAKTIEEAKSLYSRYIGN
jgi:adenylyltransferase/sulfurtransferase